VAALPHLASCLGDGGAGWPRRQAAARVLGEIPSQEVVDLLLDELGRAEPRLEFALLKSLSKLRARSPALRFEPARVQPLLHEAMTAHFDLLQLRHLYGQGDHAPPVRLLCRALREKQERNLERVFRLLGLQYPPSDMYHAYLGLLSARPGLRASALEFLDNVLQRPLKERLLPLLDYVSAESAIEHGGRFFPRRFPDRLQALAHLLQGRDHWLRACAAYSALDNTDLRQRELVRRVADDAHPVVRQAARRALGIDH
jgi:AAA family ATP:ADP antiporter